MEQILNAGERRFVVKDTIKTYSPEQHKQIAEILQSEKIVFLQRPNDNQFYLVDEILDAQVIEETTYEPVKIPFEDLVAVEVVEPTLPKEDKKKAEEPQQNEEQQKEEVKE